MDNADAVMASMRENAESSDILPADKNRIIEDLKVYDESFEALLATDKNIAERTKKMRDAIHILEPVLEKNVQLVSETMAAAAEELQETANSKARTVLVISLIAILAGIVFSIYLTIIIQGGDGTDRQSCRRRPDNKIRGQVN